MIAELLGTGQSSAIPLRALVSVTGLDGRAVRRLIQAERLHGAPILSDNQTGYYLPADEAERAAFVRSMQGRAREIRRVARAIENKDFNKEGC